MSTKRGQRERERERERDRWKRCLDDDTRTFFLCPSFSHSRAFALFPVDTALYNKIWIPFKPFILRSKAFILFFKLSLYQKVHVKIKSFTFNILKSFSDWGENKRTTLYMLSRHTERPRAAAAATRHPPPAANCSDRPFRCFVQFFVHAIRSESKRSLRESKREKEREREREDSSCYQEKKTFWAANANRISSLPDLFLPTVKDAETKDIFYVSVLISPKSFI